MWLFPAFHSLTSPVTLFVGHSVTQRLSVAFDYILGKNAKLQFTKLFWVKLTGGLGLVHLASLSSGISFPSPYVAPA